jgi:hypothetical protein
MKTLVLAITLSLTLCVAPAAGAQPSSRDADAAAIRASIESIFQAFIDKSRAVLESTHAPNWRGFLDGSRRVVRDRDGYMKAVAGSLAAPAGQGMIAYRIADFDVVFHGPSIGVASFVADVDSRRGDVVDTARLNIVDVFSKETGHWVQVASGTSINLQTIEAQMGVNTPLPESIRRQLFEAREAVWRAWFSGDVAALEALLPPELITIEGSVWGTRASVIAAARRFSGGGRTLTKLEFPRSEVQAYGRTALIYTAYAVETRRGADTTRETGTAIEVFVMRDGKWLNSGWQLAPDATR